MSVNPALIGQLELIRQSTNEQDTLDIWTMLVQNYSIAELVAVDSSIVLGTMRTVASIKRPSEERV